MTVTERPDYLAYRQFEQTVEANRYAETAPGDLVELHNGGASLAVRLRGAMIVGCVLEPEAGGGAARDILYSRGRLSNPGLVGSFAMSPVARRDIHPRDLFGKYQWLDFIKVPDASASNGESGGYPHLSLATRLAGTSLNAMTRDFYLTPDQLMTTTRLYNYRGRARRDSLGEHYALNFPGKNVHDLLINGQRLDQLTARGAEKQLSEGEPIIWPGFDGHADIRFPEGHKVTLMARTNHEFRNRLGMIIFKHPHMDSITFQPTVGVNRNGGEWGIDVPDGGHAHLTTTLALLTAPKTA